MSKTVTIWLGILVLATFCCLGFATLKYLGYRFNRRGTEAPVAVAKPVIKPGEKPVDLSDFTMIERSGEEYNFEQLRGSVWVANTFFATCPGYCRTMSKAVQSLQNLPELEGVKFVSISVDPVEDTPEDLAVYANEFSADKERWLFMHGKIRVVNRLGDEMGLRTGYRDHADKLSVFDHTGRYRDGFKFNSEAEIEELRTLLKKLLEEQRQQSEAA